MVMLREQQEWASQFHWLTHFATREEVEAFTRNFTYSSVECIRQLVAARAAPASRSELTAVLLIDRRSACPTPVKELAHRYRTTLELLGLLRPSSSELTALRRMKQFLSQNVDPLIPVEELPPDVRRGKLTGGRRRGRQA